MQTNLNENYLIVGIDTGVNTGIATYNVVKREFESITSMKKLIKLILKT
jgi:predicted RNase H-like nuclease (RuvC/YqgF family)